MVNINCDFLLFFCSWKTKRNFNIFIFFFYFYVKTEIVVSSGGNTPPLYVCILFDLRSTVNQVTTCIRCALFVLVTQQKENCHLHFPYSIYLHLLREHLHFEFWQQRLLYVRDSLNDLRKKNIEMYPMCTLVNVLEMCKVYPQ